MSVYSKLARVQARVSVPKAKNNSFGGFAFRSAEDILAGVKAACADVGALVLLQDDITIIEGVRYLVASATFIDVDTSENISVKAYAEIDKAKAKMSVEQVIGCASSYARKYALCGLFAVDNGCDIDSLDSGGSVGGGAGSSGGAGSPKAEYISKEQIKELQGLCAKTGQDVAKFLMVFGVKCFDSILVSDYAKAKRLLEGGKNAGASR